MTVRFREKTKWPRKYANMIYAIHLLAAWCLWKNRNNKTFNDKTNAPARIVEEIKEESFEWVTLRSKKLEISWSEWVNFCPREQR
ncbi:hypothetical protein Hanom_Chr06g00521361 [Helianthus anomalus]